MPGLKTPSPATTRARGIRAPHVVAFYDGDDSLAERVADFIATPDTNATGAAIVIATAAHRADIVQKMRARGVDVPLMEGDGRLIVLDARETLDSLLKEGALDRARFDAVIGRLVSKLSCRGLSITLFGEMVALLWADGRYEAVLELETMWNELGRRHDFSLLCAYAMRDVAKGSELDLRRVCDAHSHALPVVMQHAEGTPAQRHIELCELQRRAYALELEVKQRREAEQLLANRDRELSDFLENAPIAIHKVGRDGRILWANRAELAMLGYEPSEYIGRHITDFYVTPQAATAVLERLESGESLHDEPVEMRHKDGSIRDALVSSNVCWSDGQFMHTRCFTIDVTARMRAERSLTQLSERTQQMQELLSAIVESSQDAILSKSLEGIITSWNRGAQDVLGYTAEEVIGAPVQMLIPVELHDQEQAILQRLSKGETISQFETVRMAKDGRRIDVSLMLSPIRNGAGVVVGASSVARDISYRKQIEERLREEDRRKNEFIAMLGHELRNPLAPIRTGVEILSRTRGGATDAEKLCSMIERQVQHMSRLLDDLLDVTRITRGEIRLERESVDIRTVVRRAVEASQPLIESYGHNLSLDLPAREAMVHGDAVRLVQMFTNLLNNAANYTPQGGRIDVYVKERATEVEVRVKDNGAGMESSLLERIFDLFVRGPTPQHGARDGLGIGLSLVRLIAERHDGRVQVHSDGPGTGSEFIVTLPTTARSSTRREPTAKAEVLPKRAKRIVIVDDNADSAQSLAILLRLSGHDVSIAMDGHSGIECIGLVNPDLALIDIGLPDMSGYEVAERVRNAGGDGTLIATTGYGSPEDRVRSSRAGFDHHLVKPIAAAELERIVAAHPSRGSSSRWRSANQGQ